MSTLYSPFAIRHSQPNRWLYASHYFASMQMYVRHIETLVGILSNMVYMVLVKDLSGRFISNLIERGARSATQVQTYR
jgi:hypothetical protein